MLYLPPSFQREWSWIPIGAVGFFLVCYISGAYLYPGGAKFNPASLGFSLIDNYWCDLFDSPTYGGQDNPARPVALVGISVLSIGLMVLWWKLPAYFGSARRGKALAIRSMGVLGAGLLPLVASPFHDSIINGTSLLLSGAILLTLGILRQQGKQQALYLGVAMMALVGINLLVWKTGVGLLYLPLLQKISFGFFLLWVILVAQLTQKP